MSAPRIDYFAYVPQWLEVLLPAARLTGAVTVTAFALALMLGVGVVALRLSPWAWARWAGKIYLELIRGVPVLAILFLIYFGLPGMGITLQAFWAGVLGLGLSSSAYVSEVIRAGLGALHRGQREAALAIGMRPATMYRVIILPQVLRTSLPSLLSTLIVLLKDSSLCALITVNDITLTAKALSTQYFLPLQIFALAGVIYFVIAWPLSLLTRWLEVRLQRGRRTIAS